jgi:hypothetical protein
MFWALAAIMLVFAGFTVLVIARRPAPAPGSRGIDREQLKGFVYVGAAALALLAVAVIIIGLVRRPDGRAESLAVLGFFGYAAYLIAATVVLYVIARKSHV